jgi:hypothetical protein
MLVGLHSGRFGKYPQSFLVYEKILDYNEIDHIRLDINEREFWKKVRELDYFLYPFNNVTDMKHIAASILPVIQNHLQIKCYPDLNTCWHYDDKIMQYYLLKQTGFPVIDTYIFWDRNAALAWIEKAVFPLVFKLKAGSRSGTVLFLKNKKQARKIISKMFGRGMNPNKMPLFDSVRIKDFSLNELVQHNAKKVYRKVKGMDIYPYWDKQKNYVLFQRFMPNNNFDTRVTVIGERAFVGIRYNRDNDFRASGSGRINLENKNVDRRCLEIAFQISDRHGFQCMAYDFLYDENNQPLICEISYTFPAEPVFGPNGYWDRGLQWYPGHYWPQYCQLSDLLDMPDLRQPEIPMWKEETLIEKVRNRTGL